jgi:acetyl-CoA carboxylase biotin carboxyl carrier protein
MIDLRYVKKLVELLDQSTVDSIEISSEKGMKLRISKTPQQRGAVQVSPQVVMPAAPVAAAIAPPARLTPPDGVPAVAEEPAAPAESPRAKLLEVKSPMVGTFYRSPEPGAASYVAEGQRIEKGQTLCIIEAMKIMNEIESEFSGVIREIQAADAQPVEYGQVLFRIDPNG